MLLFTLALIAALAWVGVSLRCYDTLIDASWARLWMWAASGGAVCMVLAYAAMRVVT